MEYRREIDGLRALAVLPVIMFHAEFGVFSGGFVGVDVFFVISGYLITGILIRELQDDTFSIARFYERRARRILPALFVVMLACIPFAYLWMMPSQLEEFAQSLIAVVVFGSNILFWRQDGYFSAAAELKPLLHTWSLAVEEQFYLLFPIFLLLIWRLGRNWVLGIFCVLTVLSLLLTEWAWRYTPGANFFLAPTRAWELLAGSLCAVIAVNTASRSNNILGLVGLGLILYAVFGFDDEIPFPSLYALVPVSGAALIILFGTRGTLVGRILSWKGFVGIGLVSYSAYLWHQPLFAFARLRSLGDPVPLVMMALVAVTLALAWVTWLLVEQPIRKRAVPAVSTRKGIFAASGAIGAAFVSIGIVGVAGNGFEHRGNGEVSFAELDQRLMTNYGLHADCSGSFNLSDNCVTVEDPQVLLWGDSYAMHLAQGIAASSGTVGFEQQTVPQCSPILGIAPADGWGRGLSADLCIEFNSRVMSHVEEEDFDLVVLSSHFGGVHSPRQIDPAGNTMNDVPLSYVSDRLFETIDRIRDTGARVVLVSPTPSSGWDIGQCLKALVYFKHNADACDFANVPDDPVAEWLEGFGDQIPIYWLSDDICVDEYCDAMKDDVFIFRDSGHLSVAGSRLLGRENDWMSEFASAAR